MTIDCLRFFLKNFTMFTWNNDVLNARKTKTKSTVYPYKNNGKPTVVTSVMTSMAGGVTFSNN